MASGQTRSASDARVDVAFEEIRRRLISIHYELAEGPFGDRELQRRTRERLMDVMTYITSIMDARRAEGA